MSTDLIAKCLGGVVHYDGLGKVATQDGQVLDVVTIDTDTVFTEQSMPVMKKKTVM